LASCSDTNSTSDGGNDLAVPGDLAGADLSAVRDMAVRPMDFAGLDLFGTDLGGVPGEGDAGMPSTPDSVQCGSTTCDTTKQACCHLYGASPSQTCIALSGGSCPAGDRIECDETADCPAGDFCNQTANAPMYMECQSIAGRIACRSDAECTGGVRCITQTCNAGLGRPIVISTCGGDPWCLTH
jgi:hypothetical protein